MKIYKISELEELYQEAHNADIQLRSEQRTNLQLVSGDHYSKTGSRSWNRLRDSKNLSAEIKVRLTENHIGKITRIYRNSILSQSPGVKIFPKNETELQDQKAAEMHDAVWKDIKARHGIENKTRLWAKDFVELGEVFCKVFWDPNSGMQIGWEPKVDEEGKPVTDPITGSFQQGETPVMSGDLAYEVIHGFDVFRDSTAKSFEDARFIGFDKMVPVKDLKERYKGDAEKLKYIQESSKDTFRVMDTNSFTYSSTKGLCLTKEYYFRPCSDYVNGYYYITTEQGILEGGELPFGIYPILYETFDETTTAPRGFSVIRTLRPIQVEINRMVSKIAEHHMTVGDTKVFITSGAKPGSGVNKPGIRYETVGPGGQPIVVPGAAGDQFLPHLDKKIATLYSLADLNMDDDVVPPQVEPYTLLFRSIKNKKKFSLYSDKFTGFLVRVCEVSLRLMKKYAPDNLVVQAIGRNERVNIPEFKNSDDLSWQIKVEESTDDLESVFGRQLSINTLIQYVGQKLPADQLGKFIRLSPYLNKEKMFEDTTMEYDNSVNDILALDRGEYPPTFENCDHKYQLERITNRTKQGDFRFKDQNIRQMYAMKIHEHETFLAKQAQAVKDAEAGFIPSGGYSVATDFYVASDPGDPAKTKRLRVPSEALSWLVKMLDQQGSTTEAIKQMPTGNLTAINQMMGNGGQMPGQGRPELMQPNVNGMG